MNSSGEIKKKYAISFMDVLIGISILLFGIYWFTIPDHSGPLENATRHKPAPGSVLTAVIYKGEDILMQAPMNEDRIIALSLYDVPVVVEIRDQKVRVVSSSCRQQICVRKGWTRLVHDPIICLPNDIMVDITGDDPEYDAITQ